MGTTNYIFANTGQTVRLVIQTVDGYGYPSDLDGYGNWLDGYGYLLQDGYYSNPPDGYYPKTPDGYSDGYSDGYADGYYYHYNNVWYPINRYTFSHNEWYHHHRHYHCNYSNDAPPPNPYDGYYVPVVVSVMFPDLTLARGYPIPMKRLATGLYAQGVQLPTGACALGTYIITVSRMEHGNFILETYAVNAARPFGVSSVSPV